MTYAPPEANEQVLSTLNRDGSRRWLRPKLSPGRFHRRRQVVAYALILAFTVIPYLKLNGKPLLLLDIVDRQFHLLGGTFHATDTMLLMLLAVTGLVGIFLLTAIFGRVWCGWACPQTVYMEFLYRPLERLIEGGRAKLLAADRQGSSGRRVLRYGVFLLVSMFLAHTFLAYFVGVERLFRWVQQSPLEHPTAFLVMAGTTVAMMFDFSFFREQTCLVACPYGRLQSVLLDRQSLIVGYDAARGEQRHKGKKKSDQDGDCVDCHKCVTTCPTGIDIRNGLQMECIHCTQCVDACDAVMDKIGRPRGLIRYSSQAELAGEGRRFLRPRLILYPLVILLGLSLLVGQLVTRETAEVTVITKVKGQAPFATAGPGEISNSLRVRVANRASDRRTYTIDLPVSEGARIVSAEIPMTVEPGKSRVASLFVILPDDAFHNGRKKVSIRVRDDVGTFEEIKEVQLRGPRRKP
ncbi:MAG: cytochrome c oxidase accessory protein CcoG [Planctomycetota bacterium]